MALSVLPLRGEPAAAQEDTGAVLVDPGRIVFTSNRNATSGNDFDIYSMAPDGTDVQRITNRLGDEIWPALSPDGSKIAFAARSSTIHPSPMDIYTINSDGTGEVNITNTPDSYDWVYYSDPTFTPDGKVAYAGYSFENRSSDIFEASVDGSGGPTNLTNTPDVDESFPSWSPDGERIAYTRRAPAIGYIEIYTMNAKDGNQSLVAALHDGSAYRAH